MHHPSTTPFPTAGRPGLRSTPRSMFCRVAAMAVPALLAATTMAPAAGAMRIREPLPDDTVVTDSGGGTASSTSGCGPEASNRYRVTLQKFRVTSQTYDHFLQLDGAGDEVFVSYKNVKLAADGRVLANLGTNTTVTMGDINGYPLREKAGTASRTGGLRSGDVHTTNKVLWEGTLGADEVVVITPTIWEWDGGGDGFSAWSSWASQLASRLSSRAGEIFGEEVGNWIDLADIGLAGVASLPVGSAGDKPIGTVDGSGGSSFTPQMLVLDQASVAEFMSSNPIGEGPCVVGIEYAGSNDHGRYTLHLKIERT
jgi:hypothetical protein